MSCVLRWVGRMANGIPKAILTAGYCVVYNNRKHEYYLVYTEEKKDAAMAAAGLGKATLAEAKAAGYEVIKAARKGGS